MSHPPNSIQSFLLTYLKPLCIVENIDMLNSPLRQKNNQAREISILEFFPILQIPWLELIKLEIAV